MNVIHPLRESLKNLGWGGQLHLSSKSLKSLNASRECCCVVRGPFLSHTWRGHATGQCLGSEKLLTQHFYGQHVRNNLLIDLTLFVP